MVGRHVLLHDIVVVFWIIVFSSQACNASCNLLLLSLFLGGMLCSLMSSYSHVVDVVVCETIVILVVWHL